MYETIAPQLIALREKAAQLSEELNAILKEGVANHTERTRLELAAKDVSRAKKTLNLIICDSRI